MSHLLAIVLGRLPIGWMQLMHNPTRLIAAIGGVTFANVLIFMQLGFMTAAYETSVFTHRSFDADIVVTGADFRSLREAKPLPRARMYQALAVEGVTDATPIYMGTTSWTNSTYGATKSLRILGVAPDAHLFVNAELQRNTVLLQEPDTASMDRLTRDLFVEVQPSIQDVGHYELELNRRRIKITSTFEQGSSFHYDGSLVVSDQTFFRLFPNRQPGAPTLLLIQVDEAADAEHIANRINSALPESDARAFTKSQFIEAEQNHQAAETPIGFIFGFGVVIGIVVGLVIVYQVLATDVQDHLSEYATFKAIGYTRDFFHSIVLEEAVSLAALGFVPGLLISMVLYQFAELNTGLPITMPWSRPLVVLFLTILMSIVSGLIATRRLNSANPAELF